MGSTPFGHATHLPQRHNGSEQHISTIFISHVISDAPLMQAADALRILRDFQSWNLESWALAVSGRIEGEVDPSRIDVAQGHVQKALSMYEESKSQPFIAISQLFLGEVFENAGNRKEARESLQRAEEMCREMGMGYWLDRTQNALARLNR